MTRFSPLSAAIAIWPHFYRAWPGLMSGLGVVGVVCCWLVWPLSQAGAVMAMLFPHLLPLSIAAHELGHVLAARVFGYPERSIRVITHRWGFCVEAPTWGGGHRWIAAAGPIGSVAVGGCLMLAGLFNDDIAGVTNSCAIPFLAHACGLLPGIGDGRTVWSKHVTMGAVERRS